MNDWPEDARFEAVCLINEAYHELVVCAEPGLPRSSGLTIVHLMWQEILDQIQLSRESPTAKPDVDSFVALANGRETRAQMLDRHLRLVGAKLKAIDFFLRLEKLIRQESHTPSLAPRKHRALSAMPRYSQDHR